VNKRTEGHTQTSILSDTRADWSQAFALVPTLEVAYWWHASKFTREVLDGLLRIGFLHHQQIIWNKGRTVLTRTHYWFQHEPCWYVRRKNAPWFGKARENSTIWDSPSLKFIMGGSNGRSRPSSKNVKSGGVKLGTTEREEPTPARAGRADTAYPSISPHMEGQAKSAVLSRKPPTTMADGRRWQRGVSSYCATE
jgi:hypothetical protein